MMARLTLFNNMLPVFVTRVGDPLGEKTRVRHTGNVLLLVFVEQCYVSGFGVQYSLVKL